MDLTTKLFELRLDGVDLTPTNAEEEHSIQLEYEKTATELFRNALSNRLRAMVDGIHNIAARAEIADSIKNTDDFQLKAGPLLAEFHRSRKQLLDADNAIHDLNEKFVERLAANLSDQAAAAALNQWFSESTYPLVFPDPYDLNVFFDAAKALIKDSEDLAILVADARDSFVATQSRISGQMVKSFLDWRAHTEIRSGYELAFYNDYKVTMQRLQQERHDNAQETINRVFASLTEKQIEELQPALTSFRKAVEAFEKERQMYRARHDDWPSPTR